MSNLQAFDSVLIVPTDEEDDAEQLKVDLAAMIDKHRGTVNGALSLVMQIHMPDPEIDAFIQKVQQWMTQHPGRIQTVGRGGYEKITAGGGEQQVDQVASDDMVA